jgi:hypothetical protein
MLPFILIGRALQIVAVGFDFAPDGVNRAASIEKGPPSKPSLLTSVPGRPRMPRELPRPPRDGRRRLPLTVSPVPYPSTLMRSRLA